MPVNLACEELLTLNEAAKVLPRLRRGRGVHVNTLYRWISRGRAGVRLEAIKVGRTWLTSREALQRFGDRLTAQFVEPVVVREAPEAEQAERALDRHGF